MHPQTAFRIIEALVPGIRELTENTSTGDKRITVERDLPPGW